jgi:riboflavin kinase/FMN adenylyltransferase
MKVIYMEYQKYVDNSRVIPASASVAFGNFDGVHRGHRQVIQKAIDLARKNNISAGVVTFHPHPKEILGKKLPVDYLTPLSVKLKLLEDMGVDFVIVLKFNQTLASLPPQTFIDEYIIRLRFSHIIVGFDFCFGYRGEGKVDTLERSSAITGEFKLYVIASINHNKLKISSSRIRELLDVGKVQEVCELLDSPYHIDGRMLEEGRFSIEERFIIPQAGRYKVTVNWKSHSLNGIIHIGDDKVVIFDPDSFQFPIQLFGRYNEKVTLRFFAKCSEEIEHEWDNKMMGLK